MSKEGTSERSLPPCHSERSEESLGARVRDFSSACGPPRNDSGARGTRRGRQFEVALMSLRQAVMRAVAGAGLEQFAGLPFFGRIQEPYWVYAMIYAAPYRYPLKEPMDRGQVRCFPIDRGPRTL